MADSGERATATPRLSHESRTAGFTALYREHVAEVFRFVHARSQDRAIAEDVTHDVFVAVVRKFEDPAEVGLGLLKQMARHRLIDILRRSARYTEKLRLIEGGLADSVEEPAVVDRVVLETAMARLSVEHRLVLTLHYLDGQTVPALADQLGRSVKSIEGLITRANRNLRIELGEPHG